VHREAVGHWFISPNIALTDAMQRRDQASALMLDGVDPSNTKKTMKAGVLFIIEGDLNPHVLKRIRDLA